jgi:AraC-like DNA-binding protein
VDKKPAMAVSKVLHIRGMVCSRCIKVLREELARNGVTVKNTSLGRAVVEYDPEKSDLAHIQKILKKNDFSLITDRELQLVEQIKIIILQMVNNSDKEKIPKRFSEVVANELGFNYSYLSKLFTRHERITIEKYLILHKIEKIKEFLEYDSKLNLGETAHLLNYSSLSHLSKQFKEVSGISLSNYKSFLKHLRRPLDHLLVT